MRAKIGDVTGFRLKNGNRRYSVVAKHRGLGKVQEFKGDCERLVLAKAEGKARQWNEQWARKVQQEQQQQDRRARAADREAKKAMAEEQTAAAAAEWDALAETLSRALTRDPTIDWDSLKDRSRYSAQEPRPPAPYELPHPPVPRTPPAAEDPDYLDRRSIFTVVLDSIFPGRRARRQAELRASFTRDYALWVAEADSLQQAHDRLVTEQMARHRDEVARYQATLAEWEARRRAFQEAQRERNQAIDREREHYHQKEAAAVVDYCDLVLGESDYGDWAPKTWELDYLPDNGRLIVQYALPSVDAIPTLKQVRYVQSRDEFTETHHSDPQVRKRYDSLLYQIALRTMHELFTADVARALETIIFNGHVCSVDPATGHEVNPCIMSLQVSRDEFTAVNLAQVKPKACFRSLKGVGSSQLHSLTPVPPIVKLDTTDSRFVDSYPVGSTLDEGENLAAMDWEDFEHLVREVFEREFAANGAEVKVTRASRDGGIDAVVFNPDPILGGKIIIQAKRYTKTVGVAAVRELFGTVMNEGANTGVLVTTATYGPDAYAFAKDKPLRLLDGSNLLHLLQKHGHNARIDLVEARSARLG